MLSFIRMVSQKNSLTDVFLLPGVDNTKLSSSIFNICYSGSKTTSYLRSIPIMKSSSMSATSTLEHIRNRPTSISTLSSCNAADMSLVTVCSRIFSSSGVTRRGYRISFREGHFLCDSYYIPANSFYTIFSYKNLNCLIHFRRLLLVKSHGQSNFFFYIGNHGPSVSCVLFRFTHAYAVRLSTVRNNLTGTILGASSLFAASSCLTPYTSSFSGSASSIYVPRTLHWPQIATDAL